MRLRVIKAIFFVLLFLVVLRLGYWQVFRYDDLTAKAEGQRTTKQEVVAPRGDILFSDGSTLATTQPSFLIYLQPKLTEQIYLSSIQKGEGSSTDLVSGESKLTTSSKLENYKKDYSDKLAQFFWQEDRKEIESTTSAELSPIDDEEKKKEVQDLSDGFYKKLSQDLFWVNLNRKVNLEQRNRLEKLNLAGLGFEISSLRNYPEGSSSAHLLGFVSSDAYGEDTGYFGLEGFYNGELRGKKGLLTEEKDAMGLPILIGNFFTKEAKPGKTLVLNINRSIQHIAEEKIKAGAEKFGAKSASVVIMDPKTGKVLAMASVPSYDPSKVLEFPKENFKNPVVADSYEPGSTFKTLVMAAGINEGVVKDDTRCDKCDGPVNLAGFTIRTWDNHYLANQTMAETIIHSDNTGMVFVAEKLGINKMFDYIKKYGFGQTSGIDLQDESSPPLRDIKDWKEIDLATASFGQGISVTPLQLVSAVSTIANGGKLMQPQIVSQIRDEKGVFKINPRQVGQPISPETANTVKEMMVKAVDLGEAQFYKKAGGVKDFKIAGKTGTAQIAVAGHYDASKTIASFIGFAPADDPKFIMLVRYDEPSASIYGAETAAPTFFDIAKELFLYFGVTPAEQ